jgi:F-type H+-transporting ATPase subunit delta
MINAAVARRYAKALLGAALDDTIAQGVDEIAPELSALAATVQEFNGLELLVLNPAIDNTRKAAVLGEVAERLGAGALTRRFVDVLAAHERIDHLVACAESFAALVDAHQGVINAEITSPVPLGEAEIRDLRDRLASTTGRTVRLRAQTDPELLGGLRTRIGDNVYDGSLRFQLERMRERLTES